MEKLINGIIEFRKNVQEGYRESFARLATGQSPDTLFIACSDSRVVPNIFASTDPGDLFVLRNVGNLIPPYDRDETHCEQSEAVAIEFSLQSLNVSDIIVCGHSECAAMQGIVSTKSISNTPHLQNWLRHGQTALERLHSGTVLDSTLMEHNHVSQLNVLLQIEHLKTYPIVKKRIEEGSLTVHGWWFDIAKADVYAYVEKKRHFILIDENFTHRSK